MKTGFIGAGKAGFTLGKYFKERGGYVTGYYSRNPESAKEAAAFTGTEYFETLEQIIIKSDILFLSVPDSAIESVWNKLRLLSLQNKIICHLSGLLSSRVFDGIEQKQAFGYSVHPLFAINSRFDSYKEISRAVFTIEGDAARMSVLREFIGRMGNQAYIITAEQKTKYHAAAVFLSNHITALAHVGCKMLYDCGFDSGFTGNALKTLFLNHCRAIAEQGTINALTGPVERNDLQTVKKHMECLGENEAELYGLLSMQLIEISKEKHAGRNYLDMELLIEEEMGRLD